MVSTIAKAIAARRLPRKTMPIPPHISVISIIAIPPPAPPGTVPPGTDPVAVVVPLQNV